MRKNKCIKLENVSHIKILTNIINLEIFLLVCEFVLRLQKLKKYHKIKINLAKLRVAEAECSIVIYTFILSAISHNRNMQTKLINWYKYNVDKHIYPV